MRWPLVQVLSLVCKSLLLVSLVYVNAPQKLFRSMCAVAHDDSSAFTVDCTP